MKFVLTTQKKNVVVLYLSTFLGLLLGILSSVINTRNLDPIYFGDVRYVQNIISFFSSVLLLGYFTSGSRLLALSKCEDDSRRIRGAMVIILFLTTIILSLIMCCFYYYSIINGKDNLTPLYLVTIFFNSNVVLLNYVNTTAQGDNHVGRIAIARLVPTVLYILIAGTIYYFYGATSTKMILLYNGISILVLSIVILSTNPSFKNLNVSLLKLHEENKKYGIQVYIGSLSAVTTTYLAGITLGMFCADNANVGYYTLASTLSSPLAMLPSIIGTTYFKEFASQIRINRKVLFFSIGITLLSLVLFILFIGVFVDILYNSNYKIVSVFASFIAIGTCSHGLGDMFNRFLGSHGLGKQIRNGAFVCGFVTVMGNIFLVYFLSIHGAIITRILADLAYLIMMSYYYKKTILSNN